MCERLWFLRARVHWVSVTLGVPHGAGWCSARARMSDSVAHATLPSMAVDWPEGELRGGMRSESGRESEVVRVILVGTVMAQRSRRWFGITPK